MTLLCGRRHTRYLKNPSFHPYRHSARHVQTFCKAANCSHTRKLGLTKRHHYQQPSQTTKLRTGQKGFLLNNTNVRRRHRKQTTHAGLNSTHLSVDNDHHVVARSTRQPSLRLSYDNWLVSLTLSSY
ncbi:hypothetical protein BaRGS_00034389 [Batillaria attramentaria]|uniref:Uncharacterized protein n=1 Tax=Batillaria attramentaria TaxID=370345 RepID=A0ABD0JHB5_9CAEN